MHWLPCSILVGALLALQSALAPHLAVFGQRPDWLLVFVVFLALYGRPKEAVVTSWLIGFAADLMSIERLGFLAFSYTVAALLVVGVREYLFCHRASTHFVTTVVVGVLIRLGWAVYGHLVYGVESTWTGALALGVLWGAMYTAAWAPALHGGLLLVGRTLGLSQPRYSHHGLSRMMGTGV